MSDFKCSACKTDYDAESNPPRLFPDCGHSVCTECLVSFVDAKLDIACPEDDKPNSLYENDKRLGLNAFPINFSLLPLIEQHRRNNPPNDDYCEEAGEERRSEERYSDAEDLLADNSREFPDSSEGEQPLDSSGDSRRDTPKDLKEEEEIELFENDRQEGKSITSDDGDAIFDNSANSQKDGDEEPADCQVQKRLEQLRLTKPALSTIEEEMSKRNFDESPDRLTDTNRFGTAESNEQLELPMQKLSSEPFDSPNQFERQKEDRIEDRPMKDDNLEKKEETAGSELRRDKKSTDQLSEEELGKGSKEQSKIPETHAETVVNPTQNDSPKIENSEKIEEVTNVKGNQITLPVEPENDQRAQGKPVSPKQSTETISNPNFEQPVTQEPVLEESALATRNVDEESARVEGRTPKTANQKPVTSPKKTESEGSSKAQNAPASELHHRRSAEASPSSDALTASAVQVLPPAAHSPETSQPTPESPFQTKLEPVSQPKLESPPSKPKTCSLHNKPCDIVCLTDRSFICHKCALFGEHKSHDYKEIDDFRRLIEEKVNEVWLLANTLGIQKMDLNTAPLIDSFKAKVQEKRANLLKQLADKATEIYAAIDKRVSDFKEKIDLMFSDFEETYHYIETNSKYLLEKNIELSANLEAGSSKLIQEPMDIQFYLDNYYGELGLAEQTRRHHDQVTEFEATSKSSIDLRLSEIRADFDVRALLAAIRTTFDISKNTELPKQKTREPSPNKPLEKEPKQLHVKINSRDFGRPKSGKDVKKEDSKEQAKHGTKDANEAKVANHTPNSKSKMAGAAAGKDAIPTSNRKPSKSTEVVEHKETKTGTTSTASKNDEIGSQKITRNNPPTKSKDKDHLEVPSKSQKKVTSPKTKDKPKQRRHTLQQEPSALQEIAPITHTRNQPSSNSMLNVLNNLQSGTSHTESIEVAADDLVKKAGVSRETPSARPSKDEEPKAISPILGHQALEFKATIQPGLTINKVSSEEPSFEHQQASLIQELQTAMQEEKNAAKSGKKPTNISQNRSINEEDSLGGSFEHSAGERLFKNDDGSHSSLEEQPMEEVHGDEHPDGLFENDRQGAHDDSINQRQAVSFLKKNPMKAGDLSGIYSAQSGNSPGNSRIINDAIRNGGRGFQTIGLNKQKQPDYQGYYGDQMTNSAVRQGGLQQNFNSRVGQPSITIQSNYIDQEYGQFSRPGVRTVTDEYEGSGPNNASKKSFLNPQGGHRQSLYTISQANLQQLQLQSDFREPPSTKNSRGSALAPNINYEHMTSSQVGFNQPFNSRKLPMSSSHVNTGQGPPTKSAMAKNPNREDLDQEMNFSNKAVNISRLPEILAAVIKNPRVKLLNLNNNFINEKGVELICEKLMSHPTLEVISLNGNDIEEEVFEMMLKKFKNNKKLKSIFMRDNKRFKNFPLIRKNVGLLRKMNVKVEL